MYEYDCEYDGFMSKDPDDYQEYFDMLWKQHRQQLFANIRWIILLIALSVMLFTGMGAWLYHM